MYQWILIAAISNPWAYQITPAAGPAEAIGGYADGCLQGGVPLAEIGPGYQVLRPERRRYYSHPVMHQYILDLARQAHKLGLPDILVGDMAMPKGGPFSSGHKSHQMGLDADFWFRFSAKKLTTRQRNTIQPVQMVDFSTNKVTKAFTNQQITLLKLAAQDPRVERIFVNPPIKEAMCEHFAGTSESWMGKLRPWFGHDTHFHVRLRCPVGSKDCQSQAPVPAGDGCGEELQSWLSKPATVSEKPVPNKIPVLPERCQNLLMKRK